MVLVPALVRVASDAGTAFPVKPVRLARANSHFSDTIHLIPNCQISRQPLRNEREPDARRRSGAEGVPPP
jgi:hypothetical protein